MTPRETGTERLERTLLATLRQDCPPALELGEYEMGLLPPAQSQVIRAHVMECPHCQSELRELDSFLSATDESLVQEIVEAAVEWAHGLLSAPAAVAAGLRGGASRSRTFVAGPLWLAVTVQDQEDGLRDLLALVTSENGVPLDHGSARLEQNGQVYGAAEIDGYGNLVICGVTSGEYDLRIEGGGARVLVRGVTV